MPSPLSRFLPDDFRSEPIGLIAGKGDYPALSAQAIRQAGTPLRLVSLAGETDSSLVDAFPKDSHIEVKVGQLAKLIQALKKLGCRYALMAGQVTPKRLFRGLHPDLKTLKILNQLKIRNAETIFGAIASEIEASGIEMLDARAFLDAHMATAGLMTPGRSKSETPFIRHGIRTARGIADLDIGQGCVVRKGTVLAVEAFEGTDSMLERAGHFKTEDTIFVKTAKRSQDYRFDVPVFGARTLQSMHAAGIRTAVLGTEQVILLDKARTLAEATRLKIDLRGFDTSNEPALLA